MNGLSHTSVEGDCIRCDVSEIVVRRVSLLCPDQNGKRQFSPRIFDLGVPQKCRCAPCSQNIEEINNITTHL